MFNNIIKATVTAAIVLISKLIHHAHVQRTPTILNATKRRTVLIPFLSYCVNANKLCLPLRIPTSSMHVCMKERDILPRLRADNAIMEGTGCIKPFPLRAFK